MRFAGIAGIAGALLIVPQFFYDSPLADPALALFHRPGFAPIIAVRAAAVGLFLFLYYVIGLAKSLQSDGDGSAVRLSALVICGAAATTLGLLACACAETTLDVIAWKGVTVSEAETLALLTYAVGIYASLPLGGFLVALGMGTSYAGAWRVVSILAVVGAVAYAYTFVSLQPGPFDVFEVPYAMHTLALSQAIRSVALVATLAVVVITSARMLMQESRAPR